MTVTVNTLSQLEDSVKDKKYPDITKSLSVSSLIMDAALHLFNHGPVQAVKQLSASFKQYTSVPHIGQLWKRTQELQGEIRTLLESEFDS